MTESQEKGIIGAIQEDGYPVIFKYVDDFPCEKTRGRFAWLTVVSWEYDRDKRNGMPPEEINLQMIALEHAIENIQEEGYCLHAYSRTGNGLKELVYYISDRDQFMNQFNEALKNHTPYPIEVTFYEDVEWKDFKQILEMFRQAK